MHRGTRRYLAITATLLVALAVGGCVGSASQKPASSIPAAYPSRSTWRPHSYVAPIVMSKSEMLAQRKLYLREWAKGLGLSSWADTPLERIGFPEEVVPLQVECLRTRGHAVNLDPGESSYSPPGGQRSAKFERDRLECEGRFFVDPRLSLAPTEAQLRVVWEYLSDFLVPCLRAHGVEVSSPPSGDHFVATGGRGWDYPSEATAPSVANECRPRMPSAVFLGESR